MSRVQLLLLVVLLLLAFLLPVQSDKWSSFPWSEGDYEPPSLIDMSTR